MARLAFSDARRLFRPDGTIIPLHELDEDTAATVAAFEIETSANGITTTKIKLWDKGAALEMAMKRLGLFARESVQQRESLQLQIVLVK